VFAVSAATGEGTPALTGAAMHFLEQQDQARREALARIKAHAKPHGESH
jgi:hypothetical protein